MDDDIRPLVLREAANLASTSTETVEAAHFEDIFQLELQKYGIYRDLLAGNERRQDELLAEITRTNEEFLAARKTDPILKEREESFQKFDVALSKHQEIAVNLTEALRFYQDCARLLDQLRNTVKEVLRSFR